MGIEEMLSYAEFKEYVKLSYAPYIAGIFALVAGIAYPTCNIVLNKLYIFDKKVA